jgi:hypothetical protein
MSALPPDDLRAIKLLRQLLGREADAIDWHYMHAHLQILLYRSRDVFASALEEYDAFRASAKCGLVLLVMVGLVGRRMWSRPAMTGPVVTGRGR